MEYIAELLRETRENNGIELSEVSKDLEIGEVYLKNIEEGKIGSFKDIFLLKSYIADYAKYLGLDSQKIINEFNESLFEYTSRIPIKEIEKTIEQNIKEQEDKKIQSPYTKISLKTKKGWYVLIYIFVFILVILTIFWSINQITVDKKNAYVVSYRK